MAGGAGEQRQPDVGEVVLDDQVVGIDMRGDRVVVADADVARGAEGRRVGEVGADADPQLLVSSA